ncbi:glutathione transferase GstA [Piscinibacter sp. XHJ-5]|uniref:glutathione transferase GstA n=1 Tax=Piscinibacter sp. XHJ-5 TaxID=3037797 RepID=UPI002452C024|nr:glutathione transferase GstA [Piscinibacter sp. XHJ-5]
MKLYYAPGVCSLSPHIALREAGLEAQLVKVDIAKHTLADGSDYRQVNPLGYVPVLVLDDGEQLQEGPAIVQYIADLAPASGLAPAAGTMERYRLQSWLAFVNSELHKASAPLFDPSTPAAVKDAVRAKFATRLDWVAQRLGEQAYLLGDRFSVADGYLFTVLSWGPFIGIDLARWPVLKAYHERVGSRPAVKAAMRAEGLLR